MMARNNQTLWDLIVIGAGPGGYSAAIRAAQLGWRVVCIDQRLTPGGTCLHAGCIPSKALLDDSHKYVEAIHTLTSHHLLSPVAPLQPDLTLLMARKQRVINKLADGITALFKKQGVTMVCGRAEVRQPGLVAVHHDDSGENGTLLQAPRILLAMGSVAVTLPQLPYDGDRIVDAAAALSWTSIPRRLVVVGAGAIGLELGSLWARLGSQVTLVESQPDILLGMEALVVRQALRLWQQQVTLLVHHAVVSTTVRENEVELSVQDGRTGTVRQLAADRVLVAVGRCPNREAVSSLPLAYSAAGRMVVDEHFETSIPGLFAIGDLIDGPMLAHKATDDGIACVEQWLEGREPRCSSRVIPHVVYTDPELVAMGMTTQQAQSQGIAVRSGSCLLAANGRAQAADRAVGVVRVIAAAADDRLLGVHACGPQASEMMAMALPALQHGWSSRQLGELVVPHPSLAEALKEAALLACHRAIHG
ncbi:MAG: dihydrolipoyl dehydrogenase [Magnetococcales bacterium]|nr:dihydrolipoyl dehydrogenase [Magnetococcales bacterium]